MQRTSIILVVISILMLYSSVLANNATEKSAVIFFEKYISLGENFDESVADLYSDNAKISTYRRYPHGLEKAMEIDGSKWKLLVKKTMPPNWLIRLPAGVSALIILVFTFLFFDVCNNL